MEQSTGTASAIRGLAHHAAKFKFLDAPTVPESAGPLLKRRGEESSKACVFTGGSGGPRSKGKPPHDRELLSLCHGLRRDLLGCAFGHALTGLCRPMECTLDWMRSGSCSGKYKSSQKEGRKD